LTGGRLTGLALAPTVRAMTDATPALEAARQRLIFALDVPTADDAERLVVRLAGAVGLFKVGLELFCASGPAILERLSRAGARCFLDLKLHDVPETVRRAVAAVRELPGVELLTVHAAGGPAMLQAAVSAAGAVKILAVTALTSLDAADLEAVRLRGPLDELVVEAARLARRSGCAGVICSPREAAPVRAACPAPFLVVTPGVRPAAAATQDQKRVATAAQAIAAGADRIVVGRPIRDAVDPVAAARALVDEIAAAR
jgi:orotidine-5'-phosphate decarboxylase